MAELNNEEIRSTLQDLISSPDFNINDPDTKKQLNSILNQINVYSYLNHNKNYIGIRCLSEKEYNKFIQSGTLDGSITKNDINTWHYYNNFPSSIGFNSATNSNALMTTGSIVRELLLNNISNTGASKAKTSFYCNAGCSWMGTNFIWTSNIVDYYNKNFASGRVHVSAYGGIRWDGYHSLAYAYYDVSLAFRPAFQYIDNNKSKNMYY